MLMLRSVNGLGAVMPASMAPVSSIVQQGGAAEHAGEHTGTITLKQHHFFQIYDEIHPGHRPGSKGYDELLANPNLRTDRWRAAAAGLPACPTESVTKHGCYYTRYLPLTEDLDGNASLMPPGSFEVYGVPFVASDLKDGMFRRTLRPSRTQRGRMEHAIIKASYERFFDEWTYARRYLFGRDSGLILKSARAKSAAMGFTDLRRALLKQEFKPSVNFMLDLVPDMMLFHPNFERNPIQPTPAERTGEGGWSSWLARGGYPISRALADGQIPISDPIAVQTCASLLCKCPNGGLPSCVPAAFGKNGISESGHAGFYPYIKVSTDVNDPWFSVALRHDDPSWIERVGNAGEWLMNKIMGVFCAAAPAAQQQLVMMTQEKCTTKAGDPCTKGAPGCTCVQPPAATTTSVALVNVAASQGCAAWVKETTPIPMPPPPLPDPPPPPPPPPPAKIPWWAIVAGGLTVGAIAFTRK